MNFKESQILQKKAYIFCNNDYKGFEITFDLAGIIIASDGGGNFLCANGIIPDILIGDCDSIAPECLAQLKGKTLIKEFPSSKDKTDTELALDFSLENGYTNIMLINAIDGRFSHSLANIFLLEKFAPQLSFIHLLNKENEIFIVKDYINIFAQKDELFSLIPLTESVSVIETKGLKFTLKNEKLFRESTRGISNSPVADQIEVRISKGILLIIKEKG